MTRTEEDAALVDRLAATIQARVLSGEFASGSRLRQESLATEFGVSRTPVREALRKLQAAGIVQLEPRRGARVRGPSAREVREAYEVRAELEGLAASLASGRMRDEELYRLRAAQELFHEASGNNRLAAMLADLHQSFPRDLTWIVLGESSHLLEENVAQHAAVLEAIEARDAEAARRQMVDHVLRAGDLVVRRFEERAA